MRATFNLKLRIKVMLGMHLLRLTLCAVPSPAAQIRRVSSQTDSIPLVRGRRGSRFVVGYVLRTVGCQRVTGLFGAETS